MLSNSLEALRCVDHLTLDSDIICRDLDAEIRSRHGMGHVPALEFQKLALRMLDNLGYLHRAGVVHRDVKASAVCWYENILQQA